MRSVLSSLVVALSVGKALAQSGDVASQLVALATAATESARFQILSDDSDFKFDFNAANKASNDGASATASVANFPALFGEGLAMVLATLGPCGMNTPHTHPRATEMLYVINGTIEAGMIQENGARFVYNTVPAGSATLFPKGSIHYQQNLGCEPMTFLAALNNEDPGTQSTAQRFFGLPPAFVAASLGDLGVVEVAGLESKIPDVFAFGTDECLQRCNITRPTQPTTQRQPRVSANALPSGFSGPPPPAAAAATAATSSSVSSSVSSSPSASATQQSRRSFEDNVSSASSMKTQEGYYLSQQTVNVALVGLVGLMAIGYLAIALVFIRGRSQEIRLVDRREFEEGQYTDKA